MTNNMDEFEQEPYDPSEPNSGSGEAGGKKEGFMETLRNKPILKLVLIMVGVGAALAIFLGTVSPDKKPIESQVAVAPQLNEPPGGAASPFFIEQNNQANKDRAEAALNVGGSALPTPVGHDVTELVDKNKKDPLVEFREETERLKREMRNEQQQHALQLQALQQQVSGQAVQGRPQDDDSLARAMQKQMETLMDSWTPRGAKMVNGYAEKDPKEDKYTGSMDYKTSMAGQAGMVQTPQPVQTDKILVPAGAVNYVQLLTEANSDIPGPILAQILSGPLSGGRAIGRFQVMNDYLVMSFNLVSLKGKEYSINAIALDPDTTLGGLASEVDHRYFSRVLLPAAGAFVSAFGKALSETSTTTTVSDGSVLQDQAKKGSKEAIYSGLGEAGETISDFFRNEANNIKTLVRVAVGTPMGLFFLTSVKSSGQQVANPFTNNQPSPFGDASTARQQDSGPYQQKNTGIPGMSGLSPQQSQMLQGMMSSMSSPTGYGSTYSTRR